MSLQLGSVLRLSTQSMGDLFFEITSMDDSGIRLKYLCRLKDEHLYFERKTYSQIYKSEIGKHYFELNESELSELRKVVLREIYRLFVLLKFFV